MSLKLAVLRIIFLALVPVSTVFVSSEVGAQSSLDDVVNKTVIRSISNYEFPANDILTPIIQDLGYSPKSPELWRAFPAARKLTAVYNAAESTTAGDGTRALAAVAKRLSARFDSLKNNPRIAELVKGQDTSRPFKFNLETTSTFSAVPGEARSVIHEVSPYVEGGRLGGSYGILGRIFGLDSDVAYSILVDSTTIDEALLKGLGQVPASQQHEKLSKLIAEAKAQYPAQMRSMSAVEELLKAGALGGGIPDTDPIVDCLCGERLIGHMRRSLCMVGTPCR